LRRTGSRSHLVEAKPGAPPFTTGALIPQTGIYRVTHAEHRLPHEVILFDGEQFPRCSKCQDLVRFEMVYAAEEVHADESFRVIVHELPAEDKAA
jgi:hypothetical protein